MNGYPHGDPSYTHCKCQECQSPHSADVDTPEVNDKSLGTSSSGDQSPNHSLGEKGRDAFSEKLNPGDTS